nr:uncharacterized protein LOC113690867 isoform X1 [Coffea arabica]
MRNQTTLMTNSHHRNFDQLHFNQFDTQPFVNRGTTKPLDQIHTTSHNHFSRLFLCTNQSRNQFHSKYHSTLSFLIHNKTSFLPCLDREHRERERAAGNFLDSAVSWSKAREGNLPEASPILPTSTTLFSRNSKPESPSALGRELGRKFLEFRVKDWLLAEDFARTRNSILNLISELHSWFWKLKAGCLLKFSFWIVFEYYNLFCGL